MKRPVSKNPSGGNVLKLQKFPLDEYVYHWNVFVQNVDFEQLQFQRVGTALSEFFFFLLKLSSLWVFGEKLFWSCKTSFGRIFLSLKYFFWLIVHKHHKKWSFPLRISSVNTADLVTFTEEILNGKLYFLCTKCQLRGITVLEGGRDILWILLICFGFITSITGKLF